MDAISCFPMTPPEVITGGAQFDRDIGFFEALPTEAQPTRTASRSACSPTSTRCRFRTWINGYTFQGARAVRVNPGGPVNDYVGPPSSVG